MKNNTQTETETATAPASISKSIELIIVQGETSGLIKIDERTGSVIFPEDLTFDQWKEGLRAVRTIRKKAAIAVADFLSHGAKKWGAKAVDEALEQLELEATLVKTATAINSVPRALRFEHLEGEHYVELAKADLPRAGKIRWARIASEQRLTPAQLRFSMIEGEVVDQATARGQQTGIYTVQGIRQSFDVWHRRVGGIEGVKAMDVDHQVEIFEEIEAIWHFADQLGAHLATIQRSVGSTHAPNNNAA